MPRKNLRSPSHPKTEEWDRVSSYAPDTLVRPMGPVSDTKNAPQLNQSPNAATKMGFLSARRHPLRSIR